MRMVQYEIWGGGGMIECPDALVSPHVFSSTLSPSMHQGIYTWPSPAYNRASSPWRLAIVLFTAPPRLLLALSQLDYPPLDSCTSSSRSLLLLALSHSHHRPGRGQDHQ